MKKISLITIIALLSLSLFSCNIESPRPNKGTVTVVLQDIPASSGGTEIKAVSIWYAGNEWKADNVNGSAEYIVDVVRDANGIGTATFTLSDYVLSVPLQFQFTPMPTRDTKMGEDWWSFAISGSSAYAKDKNNIVCDFIAKGGYNGCKLTVSKSTYGASYWAGSYPLYGVSSTRWFNEDYKNCFIVE